MGLSNVRQQRCIDRNAFRSLLDGSRSRGCATLLSLLTLAAFILLQQVIMYVLETGAGTLLLAGLWTPIAGTLAAAVELWCAFEQPRDSLTHILLVTLGAALVLVGPGAWSVDARLFGWKRINIRNRKS